MFVQPVGAGRRLRGSCWSGAAGWGPSPSPLGQIWSFGGGRCHRSSKAEVSVLAS